mmetsp:Transcript_39589/g.63344  ORF Transcript_39589/g.63344 Transcript_39589/m.63344 type:complete len:272 (+) Transcript_39589:1100-1915(+)
MIYSSQISSYFTLNGPVGIGRIELASYTARTTLPDDVVDDALFFGFAECFDVFFVFVLLDLPPQLFFFCFFDLERVYMPNSLSSSSSSSPSSSSFPFGPCGDAGCELEAGSAPNTGMSRNARSMAMGSCLIAASGTAGCLSCLTGLRRCLIAESRSMSAEIGATEFELDEEEAETDEADKAEEGLQRVMLPLLTWLRMQLWLCCNWLLRAANRYECRSRSCCSGSSGGNCCCCRRTNGRLSALLAACTCAAGSPFCMIGGWRLELQRAFSN